MDKILILNNIQNDQMYVTPAALKLFPVITFSEFFKMTFISAPG